ncbi:MAG: hypothetical protein QXE42_00140 [Candidatus Aenigmatarchaeota archaeon]
MIGKKILTFITIIIGMIFLSFLITNVAPLMIVPTDFYPWVVFFFLCLIFFFFYSAYKSI